MDKDNIKVFVKNNKGTFRRILKKHQYRKNNLGQIFLPKDHYSKGYVERIISGINWDDFPLYQEDMDNDNEINEKNINNNLDFYLDNI